LKDESSKYLSHENTSFRMETIRQPTLFQMEKSSQAAKLVGEPKIERPYSLAEILLGTSAFTANGWEGSFYPPGRFPCPTE
jgi:hypothetical protein